MKKYLIIIYLLLITQYVSSQGFTSADQNLLKYWNYKKRFNEKFVVRGTSNGCDIKSSGLNIPFFIISPEGKPYFIKMADGTADLGWYMAVLATEYRILKNSNLPVDEVLRDLQNAMQTYERLDLRAEPFIFENSLPDPSCNYNGFFIRDDADYNFFERNHKKIFPAYTAPFSGSFFESDWKEEDHLLGTMSKDQVAYLMLGFSMVKKCLTDANYPYDFVQKSMEYTHKIMRRIWVNNWVIRDDFGREVKRGAKFEGMEKGWAKAGEVITGQSYSTALSADQNWFILKEPISPLDPRTPFDLIDHDYVRFQLLLMAAVGNSWESTENTGNKIKELGFTHHIEICTLIHNYLHNNNATSYNGILNEYMNSAPCDGPELHSSARLTTDPRYNGTFGWRATHKWSRAEDAAYGGGSSGQFNGLDYLLLFNLHILNSGSTIYGNMENLIDNKVYPYSGRGGYVGAATIPVLTSVVSTIKVNSVTYIPPRSTTPTTVYGDVVYKAGKEIILKPGFEVSGGASFRAYIGNVTCDASSNELKRVDNSSLYDQLVFTPSDSIEKNEDSFVETKLSLKRDNYLLKAFPNPVADFLTVELPINKDAEVSLNLYNYQGVEVLKIINHESVTEGKVVKKIDVSRLKSGLYYLKVSVGGFAETKIISKR
jgi:hypothetical protein